MFIAPHGIYNPVRLEVKEENGYRLLSEFIIDRYNSAANVGFDPLAPIVVVTPVQAKEFRLTISGIRHPIGIREIELCSMPYWHEYQWS